MAQIIDSYIIDHNHSYISLNGNLLKAQSFTGNGMQLKSCNFYLKRTASPIGTIVVEVYAHSGTFGSTGIPTGSVLATSDSINASTLDNNGGFPSPSTFGNISFTFSGTNQITLENGVNYFISLKYSEVDDGTNFVVVGFDGGDSTGYRSTAPGNMAFYSSGTWTAYNPTYNDIWFYVYGDIFPITPFPCFLPDGRFSMDGSGSSQ